MTDQYPIDFDGLIKGQVLSIQELESIFGSRYSEASKDWAFRTMGLQCLIHESTPLSCVIDHGAIRILTDAEASEHNYRRVRYHAHGITRKTGKLLEVDRGLLDAPQSADHDRRLRVASALFGAITSTYREIEGWARSELPKRIE